MKRKRRNLLRWGTPGMVGWNICWLIDAVVVVVVVEAQADIDYTCNLLSDSCPTQNDGVCDSFLGAASLTTLVLPECATADCFDCNQVTCQPLSYDCQACLGTMGCFWCPLDGTCHNSNLYTSAMDNTTNATVSACLEPTDYVVAVPLATTEEEDRSPKIHALCEAPESLIFRDPLVPSQQWIWDMINVDTVWNQGITGQGINVRINDLGVDANGVEWLDEGRFHPLGGCPVYQPLRDATAGSNSSHGTQVASLIGASGSNGQCGVGTAPNVTLSSCNIQAISDPSSLSTTTTSNTPTFNYFDYALDQFDISVNPLGIIGCSSRSGSFFSPPPSSSLPDSSSPSDATDVPVNVRRILPQRSKQLRPSMRSLQDEEPTTDEVGSTESAMSSSSSCPFQSESIPCKKCNFGLTMDPSSVMACEQATFDYCKDLVVESSPTDDGDARICFDYPTLLMRLSMDGGTTTTVNTTSCDFHQLPLMMEDAIVRGIYSGRNGSGIIYIVAGMGGDEDLLQVDSLEDVHFLALTHSRYTITVGAVGKNGLPLSDSPVGSSSALLVVAPGGMDPSFSNPFTSSVGGCSPPPSGNSFATPVVSGVISLMLQVNPDLTWRDVQGILVDTSGTRSTNISSVVTQEAVIGDDVDLTRTVNQAGLVHSNVYGFGIVDAGAAVEAAKTWQLYCPEKVLLADSGIIQASLTLISDASESTANGVTSSIIWEDDDKHYDDFIVESVAVVLDIFQFSPGAWEVTLTSPFGTKSILLSPSQQFETPLSMQRWKLLTVKNWGESVTGNWTLSAIKQNSDGVSIPDGGNSEGECVDAAYEASYLGTDITCLYLEEQGFCANGAPDPTTFGSGQNSDLLLFEFEGFTMEDACCACGGGSTTNDAAIEDQLTQWRIIIYGRYKDCSDQTTAPSMVAPTDDTNKLPTGPKTNAAPALAMEKDAKERLVTIAATVAAFLLISLCLYGGLRGPRAQTFGKETPHEKADVFQDEHVTTVGSWLPGFLSRRK